VVERATSEAVGAEAKGMQGFRKHSLGQKGKSVECREMLGAGELRLEQAEKAKEEQKRSKKGQHNGEGHSVTKREG
jgi:hypothetical protein